MKEICISERARFEGELNDSPAARAIAAALPLESETNRWGDEIYFDIGIACPRGGETMELGVGDIAYWPQGRCLCVFFGPTPASRGPAPVPASPVAVVGRTGAPPEVLRSIGDGERIRVSAG